MDIRTFLKKGSPLVFDGGMGTYFASLPDKMTDRCEQANLEQPELVRSIHQAYLKAGCHAIKTNTFSCGADLAQGDALASQVIEAACRIAKEAAESYDALVFADLGPVPVEEHICPEEIYCRQADLFLAQGITHFLVETLATDEGIPELARYLKSHCPEA